MLYPWPAQPAPARRLRSRWRIPPSHRCNGGVDGDLLSGSIVRTARADTVTFPELGFGAAALAVFLRVIAGVPDWLVIGAIDFLGNLDELTVDRDKVLLVLVFH